MVTSLWLTKISENVGLSGYCHMEVESYRKGSDFWPECLITASF